MEALGCASAGQSAVLVVTHRFSLGYGGVPESILLLAREFGGLDIRIDVLSGDGLARDVGKSSELPARGTALALREISRIDLARYHCLLVAGAWNPLALWLAARAKAAGVRLVYAPKGNLARAEFRRFRDLKKIPYLLTLELSLLRMSDRIVFSSDLERTHSMMASLFSAKAVVIPEPFVGPDLPVLVPSQAVRSDRTRFGFLAEIAPRKGLADLVEAFVTWQQQGCLTAELHIAGEPRPGSRRYYEAVRRRAAAAPNPELIVFHGPLRGALRERFYEEIDFFVCPTRFESFGLTPLEALWHGKPVMVTRNLGVLEFISVLEPSLCLGQGRPGEILSALGAAMTARDGYLEAAKRWRTRPHSQLSDRALALRFARELAPEANPRPAGS